MAMAAHSRPVSSWLPPPIPASVFDEARPPDVSQVGVEPPATRHHPDPDDGPRQPAAAAGTLEYTGQGRCQRLPAQASHCAVPPFLPPGAAPAQLDSSRSGLSSAPSQPPLTAAAAPPPDLDAACAVDRQRKDRQQSFDWADHLCQEVKKLEHGRIAAESQLTQAQFEQRRLQSELERAQVGGTELEHIARSNSVSDENEYLRKQLAAYADEIEALRHDAQSAGGMNLQGCKKISLRKKASMGSESDTISSSLKSTGAQSFDERGSAPPHAKPQPRQGRARTAAERVRRQVGHYESMAHGEATLAAAGENIDLRKQLAAYAVEINVLREENARTGNALRESWAKVQQLSEERDELLSTLEELKSRQAKRQKKPTGSSKSRRKGPAKQGTAEVHSGLEDASSGVGLETCHSFDGNIDGESTAKVQPRDCAQRTELANVVQDLMALVAELQESHVAQTREYERFVGLVRRQQQQGLQDARDAELLAASQATALQHLQQDLRALREAKAGDEQLWRDEVKRLEDQVCTFSERHRAAAESVRGYREEELRRSATESRRAASSLRRHSIMQNSNIDAEIRTAMDGVVVDEVDSKGGRGQRKLQVVKETLRVTGAGVGAAAQRDLQQMRWCKPPFKSYPQESTCNLEELIHIGYGHSARAWRLFPAVRPEHCFSLYTALRSFDFICRDDRDVEALVVVISRTCSRVQGWPILGGLPSHSRFLSAKGWCKVQQKCRHEGLSFGEHLLATLRRLGPSWT